MDFGVTLLLWIHLISIAVGGSTVFGIPVVGACVTKAPPTARPDLSAVMMILSRLGRGALASLWIMGLLIAWLKFGSH